MEQKHSSPAVASIKRWDGTSKAWTSWENSRRDPELWSRNGNCLVHLYGKGISKKGPSFKVNLDALFAAKLHPLIAQYAVREAPNLSGYRAKDIFLDDLMGEASPNHKLELYIPAPSMATQAEAALHHLVIRNLFAWVFRKPVAGEHLGVALIDLLNSLTDFRCPGEDNMDSMLAYMDEEGYLDMPNHPYHAIGMLHFAEHFQLKDLYTDALCHCVGMYDQVKDIPEYRIVSSATRKLIRQTKSEMDKKLRKAGQMLLNFLEHDLQEAQVRLSSGERAHLKHFRAFLTAFFTKRLGTYPPTSIDPPALVFDPNVYKIMYEDIEALYLHLADMEFTTRTLPTMAQLQTGCSILHIVHGFDQRNRYPALNNPLPLIPEIAPKASSRRISWLTKSDKLKPDPRLVAHAAMVKAINKRREIMDNKLVTAYRKFEDDAVFFPPKAERGEKISPADTRKARWSLIYCIYQVVRSCVLPPAELAGFTADLKYNIAIDTSNLVLPWIEGQSPDSNSSPRATPITATKLELDITPSSLKSLQSLANSSHYAGPAVLEEQTLQITHSGSLSSHTPSNITEPIWYTHPSVPLRARRLHRGLQSSCHTFGPIDRFSVESLKPPPLSISVRSASTIPSSFSAISSPDDTEIYAHTFSACSSSSGNSSIADSGQDETDFDTQALHPLPLKPVPLPIIPIINEPPTLAVKQMRQVGSTRSTQAQSRQREGRDQGSMLELKQSTYSIRSMRTVSSSVYSDDDDEEDAVAAAAASSSLDRSGLVPPPLWPPAAPPLPKKSSKRKMRGLYPLPLRIRKTSRV